MRALHLCPCTAVLFVVLGSYAQAQYPGMSSGNYDQLSRLSTSPVSYAYPVIMQCGCSDARCKDGCSDAGCSGACGCSDGAGAESDEPWSLWDAITGESAWNIGGWFQGGQHSNPNGLFNNHPDRYNVHQLWIYAEREASPTDCGLDWGFRADAVYGVDAQDTQSFGNRPGRWDFQNGFDHGIYGWALPQLYGEIASERVSVIFGHFFTVVGYEVVTAPGNFFYSHAYTMNNSEPFTHTGVLATASVTDDVTAYFGWTAGWDTGFDRFMGGSNFLGGLGLQLAEGTSLTYITTFADFGTRGYDGYSHSVVLDTALTDKLNYVFQTDLVHVTNAGVLDHDVGINQYLIYSLTDRLGVGTRVEWWHDDGTSFNEATFGVNFHATANAVVRPEIRHDWSPANNLAQTTYAIDSVIRY